MKNLIFTKKMGGIILKYLVASVLGLLAMLEPTIHYAEILLFAIFVDAMSAMDLNRRIKKKYPAHTLGKVQSNKAFKVFMTFIQVYSVIVLLQLIDNGLLGFTPKLHLAAWASAVFCLIQIFSILENMSSENGVWWARILQKIMVNKAERHFNIDLSALSDAKTPEVDIPKKSKRKTKTDGKK